MNVLKNIKMKTYEALDKDKMIVAMCKIIEDNRLLLSHGRSGRSMEAIRTVNATISDLIDRIRHGEYDL